MGERRNKNGKGGSDYHLPILTSSQVVLLRNDGQFSRIFTINFTRLVFVHTLYQMTQLGVKKDKERKRDWSCKK